MRHQANTFMWVVGFIAAIGGVAVVHLVVPQFQDMFTSFGAELPAVTRFFVDGRTFLWILPLAVPVASWLVPARDGADRRPGVVALMLGVAMAVGLPLFCGVAMYLPIWHLTKVVQ